MTLVFLAMEMRMKREDESYRDPEKVQIRNHELQLSVATSPSLCSVMAKWNKLTGGHFQPLPSGVTEYSVAELLTKEKRAALVFYFYGSARNFEMILAKIDRGGILEASMRHYDSVLKESARYLTVLGNLTMPKRLGERYLPNQ